MKSSVPKPLLRAATAHVSAGTNHPKGHPHPTFLPHRRIHSSSSPSPSVLVSPTPARSHVQFLQRSFSSHTYSPLRHNKSILSPLGTLALIGGAMLFLGSTASAFNIPLLSRSSAAARMKERLDKHGFIEKPVEPDGNCQMRAISDQIFGDENFHKEVRLKIINWLNANEKFGVDESGSTTLGDFLDRDKFPRWGSYVAYMAQNGAWGDHLTLVAATEVYGVTITILSNLEDRGTGQYITTITPRSKKSTQNIYLSHWHEMHYNSLHLANPVVGQQAA